MSRLPPSIWYSGYIEKNWWRGPDAGAAPFLFWGRIWAATGKSQPRFARRTAGGGCPHIKPMFGRRGRTNGERQCGMGTIEGTGAQQGSGGLGGDAVYGGGGDSRICGGEALW